MRVEKYTNLHCYVNGNSTENFPYKYYISTKGCQNFCAFKNDHDFNYWLEITGLKFNGEESSTLEGELTIVWFFEIEPMLPDYSNFTKNLLWTNENLDNFGRKNNLKSSFWMDDGKYTRCYYFESEKGNTIYLLNPNCHTRETFDSFYQKNKQIYVKNNS